ncbi:MAG: VWA domain-containing protein, partial [Methanosarcinales archaeon]|nr:VWA domain-containing protein [Methanosarcinales archaeon]
MVAVGWLLIHKGAKNVLIFSRTLIVALLITALAGPYYPIITTELDDTPSITVLSDETHSMDLFEKEAALEIYDMLLQQNPARIEIMQGIRSDIGDEVVASSIGGDHIIVVSDGNNNFGKELGESIDFVSGTGTSVYAVTRQPMDNDLSVQITGAKTAVLGNENLLGIEVRQAGGQVDYKLDIMVDGKTEHSETISQTSVMKTVSFSNTFYSLGPHVVTAEITSKDDLRPDNNVFKKTIYVVPKPRILFVTLDTKSPLLQVLKGLYDLDTASTPDGINLSDYKAVVLDNLNEGRISVDTMDNLREYVAEGGGLMVVGGDNSYDKGDYLGSELESVLPVESYASAYAGSVNVVLVLDISGSIDAYEAMDDEKAMAINLLHGMGRDTNLGVVAFGGNAVEVSDGLLPLSSHANRDALVDRVSKLRTGHGGTSIDEGITIANEMLDNTNGKKYMLVFSDGAVKDSFEDSKSVISGMDTTDIEITFVMIKTNVVIEREVKTDNNKGEYFFKVLADRVGGDFIQLEPYQRLDMTFGQESPDLPEGGPDAYAIVRLDEEHFITRYQNITGSISGYNDVTQKVGATRLVTTSMGKPVVTSWQFGLGRVVALSTDNGNLWSGGLGGLYSGENARLLPSMINWAVGDPRPDDGLVVFSSDLFLGSPGTITIRSDEMPDVTFNGLDIPVIQTEERTFEGVIEPSEKGVLPLEVSIDEVTLEDIAAVNYPLEYKDVGNNPELLEAVKRNGGGVYTMEQVRSMLFNDIRDNSVITTVKHGSLGWIPLLVALLIFLIEVIMRTAKGIVK